MENRFTALVSYGFSDRFMLYARVPVSFRDFTAIEQGVPVESFSTRGLADPELYAQLRLWASPLASGVGRRTSLSLLGGVKTALGNNEYEREGERVDEHAQPGTGSTDGFARPGPAASSGPPLRPVRVDAVPPTRKQHP